MTTSFELPVLTDAGERIGTFTVGSLTSEQEKRGRPVLERVLDGGPEGVVRLLEDCEYEYRLTLDRHELVTLQPTEAFSPSPNGYGVGRLRPGRFVGSMELVAVLTGDERARTTVEVASSKLDYESEYQSMLLRIAEEGAEIVQSSFAPSAVQLAPSGEQSAETLYQRFAFLQSLLKSPGFLEAVDQIRYRPHSEYRTVREEVDPAKALRPSSHLARELVGPGARQRLHQPLGRLQSLPRRVSTLSHFESFDTEPNRFVRFALESWRGLVSDVRAVLEQKLSESKPPASARRGAEEAAYLERLLERMLAVTAVADASALTRLPTSNTVLHSRAGYRDVYRAYLISDIASALTWEGGEDVYRAGQRDAATLYEYWVFIELIRIVKSLPGFDFNMKSMVVKTDSGWSLDLRRDGKTVLKGSGPVRGRHVELELWFNKSFSRGNAGGKSWTVNMRPDCSLRITPEGALPDVGSTWVHFDAKYRIDKVEQIFDAGEEHGRPPSAKSEDLRKMHAYRDAIRRTSGAYVIFPGNEADKTYRRFTPEVLPGLGAFALRPNPHDGRADSTSTGLLRRFIGEVIDHVALPSTSRERARYWQGVSLRGDAESESAYTPLLSKPPADTTVLLGYVKSTDHLDWVRTQSLYNLRADSERNGAVTLGSPELAADFVILYGSDEDETVGFRTTGALYLRAKEELEASGYPDPRGESYLCLELAEGVEVAMTGVEARRRGDSDGRPVTHSWQELFPADD